MTWPLLADLLIRSTVVLVAGEALRRSQRRRSSAAFRHNLLLLTFALLGLLPILSALVPEIYIPTGFLPRHAGASVSVQLSGLRYASSGAQAGPNWLFRAWLMGVLLALAPTTVGILSAMKLVRGATSFRHPGVLDVMLENCQSARRAPKILLSPDSVVPLTCGCFRPSILLPACAADWSHSHLRAVLLHELAHVRRRDVAAQVSVQIISSLWWFQPMVWLLRRTLRRECELACDAEALRSGLRPSEYAAALLVIAKSLNPPSRVFIAGISMVRPSDLELRVRAILKPPAAILCVRSAWVIALGLAGIAGASSAFTTTVQPSILQQKGSSMRHSLFSTLLTSAGLSAATVSGSLFDPSGAAIPEAKVLLYNPDTGVKQEAQSGSDGRFALLDAAGGQYILRIQKPGFSSILSEFNLKPDAKVDRKLTMEVGRLEEQVHVAEQGTPASSSEQPSPPQRVRIGGQVAEANLVSRKDIVYPTAAKTAGVQGTVELQAVISKDGAPLELRVVSSPDDDLSQASLEGVRQWRYRPTLLNGNPVEIVTTVIVNFTLSK